MKYSKKIKITKPLFFIHGKINNAHYYISLVLGDVFTTLRYKETCLYDTDEVQKVLETLKLKKVVDVTVELALSQTLPPRNFQLDNPKMII